jgi:plasmid maintenance system antidote protein VapI
VGFVTAYERLAEWVRKQPRSMTATAAALGCSTNRLSRLVNGHAKPGRALAARITDATATAPGGAIKAEDWDEAATTAA